MGSSAVLLPVIDKLVLGEAITELAELPGFGSVSYTASDGMRRTIRVTLLATSICDRGDGKPGSFVRGVADYKHLIRSVFSPAEIKFTKQPRTRVRGKATGVVGYDCDYIEFVTYVAV